MTVDGKVDSPGGTVEGHPGGGWVFDTEFLPEAYSLKEEELADTSALMFGKRSYQAFAPIWSTSSDHAAYQDLPKYVVSSSLAEADLADNWGPTTILRSTQDVAALKQEDGGAIFIHGSAELARGLAEANLVDRYNLLVFPYLLGSGRSLFTAEDRDRQSLRLVTSDTYANGVIKLIYEVTPR
jgi:dihydrofolate reductase